MTDSNWESRINGAEGAERIEHLASAPTAPSATKWSKAAKPKVLSESEERLNPFQRREAKQTARMKDEQADKPVWTRLEEFRTADSERKTVWDRNSTEAKPARTFESVPRSSTGLALDRATLDAKAAMEADRVSRQKAAEPIRVTLDAADQTAIFDAFVQATPEFFDTDFNRTNLWNFLLDCIENREPQVTGWNVASLRSCDKAMRVNGYYEKPITQRTRGFQVVNESAPKVYTLQQTTQATVIPASSQRRYERDAASEADARKLSFDELQAKARANYRKGR